MEIYLQLPTYSWEMVVVYMATIFDTFSILHGHCDFRLPAGPRNRCPVPATGPRGLAMPKQTVTTRVKSTKLTDQHPWVEILFRFLDGKNIGNMWMFMIRSRI